MRSLVLQCLLATAMALAPAMTPRATTYDLLKVTQVNRPSDQATVALPSLWREGFAGIGEEVAVVAFLRHFG